MSEFEDKLNALLSSPESMAQVAELAKKLSGQDAPETRQPEAKSEKSTDSGLSSLLGGMDPKMLAQLASLFSGSKPESGGAPAPGGLASLLDGMDPKMLAQLASLLSGSKPESGGAPASGGLASLLGGMDPNMLAQLASLFLGSKTEGGGAPGLGGLASLLGGGGSGAVAKFLPLLAQLNDGKQEERARLLYALKPFLKSERQEKVDRALQLARLLQAGKLFLKGLGE